jgi:transketolase
MFKSSSTVNLTKSTVSDIRDAFFDRLYEIASANSNLMFLTADMGACSLDKFKADLPGQFINVGVAEQNLVSVAAGLALAGKRVFIYAIAPFITQRCYEQIKVDLCCMRLPVTIVGVGAGITYGSDGPTHHATQDIAIMRALPGITIFNPSDAVMAAATAEISFRNDGPTYVRLDKGKWPSLYESSENFSHGLRMLQKGHDLTVVATGLMVHQARKVVERLSEHSIDAGIIDLYRLKPINKDMLLDLIGDSTPVVTIEEHSIVGGIGSAVSEILMDSGVNVPVKRFAIPEVSCSGYGSREWMHSFYELDAAALQNSIFRWWQSADMRGSDSGSNEKAHIGCDWAHCVDARKFAELVGIHNEEVPDRCLEDLKKYDYRYRLIEGAERDELILSALKKIDAEEMSVAGKEKRPLWEKGWSENLQKFLANKGNLDELVPGYYRPGQPCRFRGMFVQGKDPQFEYNVFRLIRSWVFFALLKDTPAVYEFGCGPGHNLVAMAKQFPDKQLFGLDWAVSAVELVNIIARQYGFNLTGRLFDLFKPDDGLELQKGAAVVTFGALEQLGDGYEAFLRYLLKQNPVVCVHVEPLSDFYDEKDLIDYIALKHHKKRNMLQAFLPRLKQLEKEAKIRIMQVQHVPFGGMFTEGWSYVVWQPSDRKEA